MAVDIQVGMAAGGTAVDLEAEALFFMTLPILPQMN
jgi:hypothetical protein